MLLFTSPPSGNYEAHTGRLFTAAPASRWSFLDTIDTNDNEGDNRYSGAHRSDLNGTAAAPNDNARKRGGSEEL